MASKAPKEEEKSEIETDRELPIRHNGQSGAKSGSHDDIPDNVHTFHMWEPLDFKTRCGYDYRRRNVLKASSTYAVRTVLRTVLIPFHKVAFGLKIVGKENLRNLGKRGGVCICNHIHPMDCTMVDLALYDRRVYYVSLESNFKIPLIRDLIRVLGAIPLSKNPARIGELFSEMEKAIDNGAFVQIYPEGVLRPYCNRLRTFRDGAFKLAIDANAPLLPMVIRLERPRYIFRLYKRKPCLVLQILPPIYPTTKNATREEIDALREQCLSAMNEKIGV